MKTMTNDTSTSVIEHPQSVTYALSATLFMSALYHGAPDVAIQGGVLLLGTAWYVHTGSEQ